MDEDDTGAIILESAIAIHREPGPGLLKTLCEVVLAQELKSRALEVKRQAPSLRTSVADRVASHKPEFPDGLGYLQTPSGTSFPRDSVRGPCVERTCLIAVWQESMENDKGARLERHLVKRRSF